MYHLATMHNITDRQTDRQTDDGMMPVSLLLDQYNRLKLVHVNCRRFQIVSTLLKPPPQENSFCSNL